MAENVIFFLKVSEYWSAYILQKEKDIKVFFLIFLLNYEQVFIEILLDLVSHSYAGAYV